MQNRQLNILKAALPYTAVRFRKPIQIMIQAQELSDYMVSTNDTEGDLEAYEAVDSGNLEGLVDNIRPYCTGEELNMFNSIIGFIRMKNMLQNYMGYMSSGHGGSMMDFMMSQLTPEQQNTYEKMSSLFGMSYSEDE